MDPLTALLFSLWIAGYFTKNVYQDAVFRARGEDPPSFRREQARWERRQARAAQRGEDGPGRQFWRNVWADAIASADERRERTAAKAAKRRHAKWADKDIADAEDEAHKLNDDLDGPTHIPDPTEPTHQCTWCGNTMADDEAREVVLHGLPMTVCLGCYEGHHAAKLRSRAPEVDSETPGGRCHFCGGEFPAGTLWADRDGALPVDACADCWNRRHGDTGPETDDSLSQPDQPTSADPAQGDAEIIQFADWQRPAASDTEKEPDMSAEITGLRSAIAYAEGSATAAERAATQDEMAIAGLQAGGTTGAAITSLEASMEGHTQNAAHYRAAAAELIQQLQVAEAYEANQGAGTREFVTAE